MLAIQQSRASKDKSVPNILPCRVQQSRQTRVTKRFWAPTTDNDGSKTAYFRGRKLKGRVVQLPMKYQGLVLQKTDRALPPKPLLRSTQRYEDDSNPDSGDDEAEEEAEPVKVLEQVSTFDHLVVWGHDHTPTADDPFVKGVEEWIAFAEAIHRPTKFTTADSEPRATPTKG